MMDLKLPLKQLMQKSAIDSTSLPNSVLNRQQSDRFIDMVVDQTVLMKNVRVVRVNVAKGEVNKLDLGQIVTEGAHTTSRATTHAPTERVMTYDTEKYRSAFDLKTDFLEDNLEKAGIRDTILGMFTKRIAMDVEMAAIQGDDALSTGDTQSAENNLLGVNDGFQKILEAEVPAGQQIDAAGLAPTMQLYYDMKRAVPNKFRVVKPDYVWITPPGPSDAWMLEWANRGNGSVISDAALATGRRPGPWGTDMLEVPLMPEDLTFGTAGTDGCSIWYTPVKNLVYFIQRDITIEWDRRPRNDVWEATIHFRIDVEVEDPDMVVIAKNVSLSGTPYGA